jgi:hypothetical protein
VQINIFIKGKIMANQWDIAVQNNRNQLAAAETNSAENLKGLQSATNVKELLQNKQERAEEAFFANPTPANQQAYEAARQATNDAAKLEQDYRSAYDASQAELAQAERAYSASLTQQAREQAVNNSVPPPATNTPNQSPTDSVPLTSNPVQNFSSQTAESYNRETNNQILRSIGAPNAGEAYVQQTNQNVIGTIATQPTVVGRLEVPSAQFNQATNANVLSAIGAPTPAESYVAQTNQSVLNAIKVQTPTPIPVKSETFEDGSTIETFADGTQRVTRNDFQGGTITETLPAPTAASVDAARATGGVIAREALYQGLDWRVRLSLAANATYLYNLAEPGDILYPLRDTQGVVFPYTPQITNSYRANYESVDIIHSNYKQYFYKNSSVDEIQITADFTAQSTGEANYVLATIHFFRTVTKMFYGQDPNGTIGPAAGNPPPLCYLFGYGPDQYKDHPLLVSQFSYTLPNDVDYIRAGNPNLYEGQSNAFYIPKKTKEPKPTSFSGTIKSWFRVRNSGLTPGGISEEPTFSGHLSNKDVTYVPTKLTISLTCIPIVTRYNTSQKFSVANYAKGTLYRGGFW